MAKTLLIYANPNMGGHCHAILERTKQELADRKIDYTFVDLNAEKYDPVMHADELYTTGGTAISSQTKKYMAQITEAEKIIFIYPIWWNSMPAMLKGYLDKTMAGRFAFHYVKKWYIPFSIPEGLLTGKKAIGLTTTGSKGWMTFIFLGNRYKKIMAKDILGFCGVKAKVFSLHGCLKWDESKKPAIDKLVKKGFNWLY